MDGTLGGLGLFRAEHVRAKIVAGDAGGALNLYGAFWRQAALGMS